MGASLFRGTGGSAVRPIAMVYWWMPGGTMEGPLWVVANVEPRVGREDCGRSVEKVQREVSLQRFSVLIQRVSYKM